MNPDMLQGAARYDPGACGFGGWQKPGIEGIPNWGIELHKIDNLRPAISDGGALGIGVAGSYLDVDNRPHIPLGLKADQRSCSRSYEYAADFIVTKIYILPGILRYGGTAGQNRDY